MAGCGSHSCLIEKPKGMGTNGRCSCFDNLPKETAHAMRWELAKLRAQNKLLLLAAAKTLLENLHLCDGDDCTLKDLRDAVAAVDPEWEG